MKSLDIKFDSENEFTCRLFDITLKDNEDNTEKPAGIAFVICSLEMVVLMLNNDIILTEDEQNKLKEAIISLYKTAQGVGFVVDIVSKDIQISMK